MRILKLLSIILLINGYLIAPSVAFEKTATKVFQLIDKKKWPGAKKLADKNNYAILKKIILSQQFLDRKYKKNSFREITNFLKKNPDWPQSYLLKLRAESYLDEDTDKKLIIDWFEKNDPVSSKGHKYYARASSELIKNPAVLLPIIKNGWIYGDYSIIEQKKYYKKFQKYLTIEDDVKKIDHCLWSRKITAAKRLLYLVNSDYKKSFYAQIALIRKHKNAEKLFRKVPKKYHTPGLIYRYLDYRKTNPPGSKKIVSLLKQVIDDKEYAGLFWKLQAYIAREYIERKRFADAYKVASNHFAISPSDVSQSEFLSGWLALRFLNKPKLAKSHFTNFNQIVKTPISKSRGLYWLARTYDIMGYDERAMNLYGRAAIKYPYTFYGQLSAVEADISRLKLPDAIQLLPRSKLGASKDVMTAAKIVAKYGRVNLAQIYIKSAIKSVKRSKAIINFINSLSKIKNIHHQVWASKMSMQKHIFMKNHAYPMPYKVSHLPTEKALTYSIVRQESVFDKSAVSGAKARGLMQLIKSTACQTAKNIGIKCLVSKLTGNTSYNLKLGSNHLQELLEQYEGSYILAIAAYNAGSHNVNKWIDLHGDPGKIKNIHKVVDWLELIPFYETRNYVQRVLENVQIYRTMNNKNSKLRIKEDLINIRKL